MSSSLPCEYQLKLSSSSLHTSLPKHNRSLSLPRFLECNQNLPYTSFLTLQHATRIPEQTFHVTRLLHGFHELHPDTHAPSAGTLLPLLTKAIHNLANVHSSPTTELQFTVLLTAPPVPNLLLHVANAQPASTVPIVVECRGTPRSNPTVKNTRWYVDRQPLRNVRASEACETILVADCFHNLVLYEGLVSNFFVLTAQNEIYTAPHNVVLPGFVRMCVLKACERLGVCVVLQPPRVADWRCFKAAFLTSARRWLQPVRGMIVTEEVRMAHVPKFVTFEEDSDGVVDRLRRCVIEIAEEQAVTVMCPSEIQKVV